jgi:hypothetical protein
MPEWGWWLVGYGCWVGFIVWGVGRMARGSDSYEG